MPPVNVAWVQIQMSTLNVSKVCCWFLVAPFSLLLKNQHLQISIRQGTGRRRTTMWTTTSKLLLIYLFIYFSSIVTIHHNNHL